MAFATRAAVLAMTLQKLATGAETPVDVPWLCGGACASNMVLQRAPMRSRLWGVAGDAPVQSSVSVSLDGVEVSMGSTAADGSWQVELPAKEASRGHEVTVRIGKAMNATLSNVAFGDVYLCGGQSNMEFAISGVYEVEEDVADSVNYPDLRLFTLFKTQATLPVQRVGTKTNYTWAVSSPAAIQADPLKVGANFRWFSAVCYFFGRDTYKALGGKVPIGLIATNWGGTTIETWSSPEALAKCNGTVDSEDEELRIDAGDGLETPHDSSVLFNGMIAPLLPMRLAGEAWYQGEQNAGHPALYACRFPAMITDYREKFSLPDLSFFYVELAAFRNNYAEIRRAQKHALALPHVGFATAIDLGFAGSPIHSPRKQEVGRRLSLSAQGIHYKMSVTYEGPTMKHVNISVAGSLVTAVVAFRSAENLHVHGTASCESWGDELCCEESPFQISYGKDNVRANYSLASVGAEGTATLTADLGVPVENISAVYVSLEFEGFPQCALYNGNGGPENHTGIAASPFSTKPEPTLLSHNFATVALERALQSFVV